jgi:preprotein translocase subunit SecA
LLYKFLKIIQQSIIYFKSCIILNCLRELKDKIEPNASSSVLSDEKTPINNYNEDMIKNWSVNFRKLNKANLKSIESIEVLELVAVISQASKLINNYGLRDTQRIAVFVFIDSMLNSFGGRLANISTGEGKSLIIISTAISQLLLRDGTVDILTSSEVLAERDAAESQPMFSRFGIKVSCNCDAIADGNEAVRRERYENNNVMYGVIGHFQRDILLTKYYGKDIRMKPATCLIVDEVDSMCIDNLCNTLYISHQIADLRYMSDMFVFIWQAVNARDTGVYSIHNVKKVCSCSAKKK